MLVVFSRTSIGLNLQLVGVMSLSRAVYLHRLGFSFEKQSKGLCFCSELHFVNVMQFQCGHVDSIMQYGLYVFNSFFEDRTIT